MFTSPCYMNPNSWCNRNFTQITFYHLYHSQTSISNSTERNRIRIFLNLLNPNFYHRVYKTCDVSSTLCPIVFLSKPCWHYAPVCSWAFQVASFLHDCPTNPSRISLLPHECHVYRPFNLASFGTIRATIWRLQIRKLIRWYNQARLNGLDRYIRERRKIYNPKEKAED